MSNTTLTRDTAPPRLSARKAMIDSQLRTSGVNEEYVLARMMRVLREDFLPARKADLAYIDRSVVLGADAHLASPLFYGKILLEGAPRPADRALVVEGGTGYLAALLDPLVETVTTVSAADAAKGKLPDGTFSLILVDGAAEQLPDALTAKLEEQGRIVSGLSQRGVTRLVSGRNIGGHVSLLPVEDLGIPVLACFNAPKGWSFS